MNTAFRPQSFLFSCLLRCWFLIALMGAIGSCSIAARTIIANEPPARPNIIFILTDDQGYGDVSAHGNPVLKTPHIDQLSREGVRFTNYHVSPTCAPTRCALMTGRHEFRSGVTHTINERERMNLQAFTYAQALQSAGYATGIFGKWHLGDEAPYQPGQRGFQEVFIHGAGGIGQTFPGSCGDAPRNSYFNPAILHNGKFEKTRGYCTDVFFAQALEWIDQQRNVGPFYCHIATNAPHAPLDCPPEYEAKYAGKVTAKQAKFFGMIENIDDNVGRLMAKLKEWQLDRNTLVIFTTDNGGTEGVPLFNAGMRGQKVTPWEGGTRVPCLWRWEGTLKPHDVSALTAHLDVFPTFVALAGAKVPDDVAHKLEGRSLLPLLKDATASWPDRLLVTHTGRWPRGEMAKWKYANCAVRNSRYKLISIKGTDKPAWELYDLQQDPGEQQNIYGTLPEVQDQLAKHYEQWWQEIQAEQVNEFVTPPAVNTFKTLYWQQFPDERPTK